MAPRPSKSISRRSFLKGSGVLLAGGLAGVAGPRLGFAAPGAGRRGDLLVYIFLRGGLDALSALVPTFDPDYYARRPGIAIPGARTIALEQGFGMHPALAALAPIWDAGELAIMQAVGYHNMVRSHFRAQELVESALFEGGTHRGWIARHLASTGSELSQPVVRGVSNRSEIHTSLREDAGSAAVGRIEDFNIGGFHAAERDRVLHSLSVLHGGGSGFEELIRGQGRSTLGLVSAIDEVTATHYRPNNDVVYPNPPLGRALLQSAQLIRHEPDLGIEVICADQDGYDTHSIMGDWRAGVMESRLRDLAESVAAFYADLQDLKDHITIVIQSEFGRQVHENGAGGCDHGSAGCMFVLGGGIRGGVYGAWPGLADHQLAPQFGLAPTMDFRDVLAEVVRERLGNPNLDAVFPGWPATPLGFADTRA